MAQGFFAASKATGILDRAQICDPSGNAGTAHMVYAVDFVKYWSRQDLLAGEPESLAGDRITVAGIEAMKKRMGKIPRKKPNNPFRE